MSEARIGVDVGGTFTDVILHEAGGRVRVHKLLSTPPSYDLAVVEAVSGLAGTDGGSGVSEVVHGTTVATNAVLQRLGAETALVTTEHFRDVLELRRLRIPHMYDLVDTRAARSPGEPGDRLDHGAVVARRRREQLVHPHPPVGLVEDHVGERATDIDPDPGCAHSITRCSFAICDIKLHYGRA